MPPVVTAAAQSSRSGLITTVIISITLAVAMIVVAVYFTQEAGKTQKELDILKLNDKGLYTEGATSDPKVNALIADKEFPGITSALDISMAQSDKLAKLVGANLTPDKAAQVASDSVLNATKQMADLNSQKLINFTIPPNASMADAVKAMAAGVAQLAADKKTSDDQVAALQKKLQDQVAADKTVLDDKDKQIADANAKADAAQQQLKDFQSQVTTATNSVTQTGEAKLKELQTSTNTLTTQLQAANTKLTADEKLITQLKGKLHQDRVNPSEAVVQRPAGTIIRVVDQNTCFISIGSHESVIKGLTFEVYDKNRGIPALGDTNAGLSDTNMPVGKASIEVFAVQADTAECRIVRMQPGEQVVIGDLIANLVFDPNTKYDFVVYGSFDLSNSGVPRAEDTELVKRLIVQWGGKIQDHIDVDTDFVVMGTQPVVPQVTDANDPQQISKKNAAEAALQKYEDQITQAERLSIPVMNQNRFLYFTGYFDQARR
jgi:uncharacterized protein (DUF697 family)